MAFGPKCSLCCTLFSSVSVLGLVIIGLLLSKQKRSLGDMEPNDRAAKGCYIAAVVYAALVVISAARYMYLSKMRPKATGYAHAPVSEV